MPVISVVYWWCWYLCHFKFAVSLWFSASLLLERYWRYYVVRLSVSACTCMLVFLSLCPEVYDHDVLETTWGNSTKFTTLVHSGTKMIWGQKVKGRDETKCGQKSIFMSFYHHRTSSVDSLNWIGCVTGDFGQNGVKRSQLTVNFYLVSQNYWITEHMNINPLNGRGVNWLHFAIQV